MSRENIPFEFSFRWRRDKICTLFLVLVNETDADTPYLCLNYSHFQDLCHCHYQFLQSYSISWVKFESSSSQVRVQFKFESRVKLEWILIVSFICLYLFIYLFYSFFCFVSKWCIWDTRAPSLKLKFTW